MLIIPAIDIRKGSCVMLTQGEVSKETVFSSDPLAMAKKWSECGAELLHIVDLDGAFSGKPVNLEIIKSIRKDVSIPIQLGGGIRNMDTLESILSSGIDYAIIGTAAITDPSFLKQALRKYKERIIVAVDSKKGEIKISGWTQSAGTDVIDAALLFVNEGVKTLLYTDVEKDGMMQGPNWDGIQSLCTNVPIKVIVSGGVCCYDDIKKITDLNMSNISGAIIGKALYTGDIDLKKAING